MNLTNAYGEYTSALKDLDKARKHIRQAVNILKTLDEFTSTVDTYCALEGVLEDIHQIRRDLNDEYKDC